MNTGQNHLFHQLKNKKSIRNIIEVDALVSEYQTFNVNAVKKRGLGLSDIRLNSSRVE
jgi:hypothetical protein